MFNLIKKNIPILETDSKLKKIISECKIVNCKRQNKSIGATLTTYRYTKATKTKSVTKCNSKKCGTCPLLLEGSHYKFLNGKTCHVNADMKCDVKNVVYAIICNNCSLEYIGETECLRDRVRVHKQQILTENLCFLKVSKHIRDCSKNSIPLFKIMPLFHFEENTRSRRRLKELELITDYDPQLNR